VIQRDSFKTVIAKFLYVIVLLNINKEERYSRVPRLSDTRYSAKGPKGNGDMQAAKRD